MSLAIKFGNINDPSAISGFIYFDAVTKYNRSYRGKITSHPIDAGASITDHFISDNPKFSLSAVISGIDFSPIPSKLFIDNESPLNLNSEPEPVTVNNFYSNLTSVLPASVLQFIESGKFTIGGGGGLRKNYKKEVSYLLEQLISGLYYNDQRKKWETRVTPIVLYELEGEVLTDAYTDLILIGFSPSENVDDWDALNFDLEFEKARFVSIEKVDAPKTTRRGAASTSDKGKVINKPAPVPESEIPSAPSPTVLDKWGQIFRGK